MLLKQLKQFTLSSTCRNAVFKTDVKRLARFYGSPAICESLKTSKVPKRLSREDRRALVESFVNEYRANNAGRFPSLKSTHKEVGGSYFIVRDIFQELKLKPKPYVPIVAKALSEVSPSVPYDASSHFSPVVVEPEFQADSLNVEAGSEQRQAIIDSSHSNSDGESNLQGNNLVITATDDKRETEATQRIEVEVCLKNSETEEEGNLTHLGNQESKADHLEGAAVSADDESNLQGNNLVITATDDKRETETIQRIEVEGCLKNSEAEEEGNMTHLGNQESKADHLEGTAVSADDESNLQGNNLVITATDDKRETEATQRIEVDVCLKKSETEEEGNLTHLGNQESKADHLEGAAVSADVVPTETRQVSETGAGEVKETGAGEGKETGAGEVKERSSAWSNIMSFAKEFANIWRKG